jgi:hypothetical protein
MIRTTLMTLLLLASTIAAIPPGGGTGPGGPVGQPQQPPPAPAPPPVVPLPAQTGAAAATPSPDPAMLAQAKNVFAQLQNGKLDRTALTTEMSTALTDDKLAAVKSSIGTLGAPVSFEQEHAGTQTGVRYGVYLVTFSNGAKLDFLIGIDGQGKIAGMRLTPIQ